MFKLVNFILNCKLQNKSDIEFKNLIINSGFVFLFRLLGLIFGFILTFLITKFYGTEILGIYTLSFTMLTVVAVLSRLGLDEALVKIVSGLMISGKKREVYSTYKFCFQTTFITAVILTIIFYLSSNFFSNLFDNKKLDSALKIISLSIVPYALLKINSDLFKGMKETKYFSYFQTGSVFLLISIFIILFRILTLSSNVLFISIIVSSIFILIISILIVNKFFNEPIKRDFNISKINLLKLSIPMMVTSSMFMVLSWTDNLLLGFFLKEQNVGIYFVTYKISLIISFGLFAVNSVISPKFSESYHKNDLMQLKKTAIYSAKLNFYLGLILTTLLFFCIKFILSIYGEEFKIAYRTFYILIIGQLFNTICGSVLNLLNMTGKEILVSLIILSAAILNFTLNYYLIPIMESSKYFIGIEGAALSSTICLIYWNVLGLFFVKKYYGFLMIPFLNKLK